MPAGQATVVRAGNSSKEIYVTPSGFQHGLEEVLIIVGGVFVMEALSVIFQVVSYKLRRKRVFLMAPIHHHYELKGWPEPQIIVRFWIISFVCAVIGLSTLKLR